MSRLLPFIVVTLGLLASPLYGEGYKRASESDDNVKRKLFPRAKKVELDIKAGLVLNSSFVQTYLVNGGVSYFFSEEWGMLIEGNMGITSDKSERECLETFYNDPDFIVGPECGAGQSDWDEAGSDDANYGPAYMGIRELKFIFAGSVLWNPIYGKQIILLSGVGHFDLFVAMGGGIALSDYYAKSTELQNGDASRGGVVKDADGNITSQPGTKDETLVGQEGRPPAESQSNLTAHFSIGQRFHFARRFMLLAELKNYTLLGTPSGFDNFFSLMGGFGVRF
jgi:outer membrane beta-barrel protein